MKVTYLHHSGFLAETEHAYLLFDYIQGELPTFRQDKSLWVFVSHRHGDHFLPDIFRLGETHQETIFILSDDIWQNRVPEQWYSRTEFIDPGQELSLPGAGAVKIRALKSTDEGVAFLVTCDEKTFYHAGDLNNWMWPGEPKDWNHNMCKNYRDEIEKMQGEHVDVAFVPLDCRQEEYFYLGMDDFMRTVGAKVVFPMHFWDDFSLISRMKQMECAESYQERIMEIERDGQEFLLLENE
ncbi:MAG: MBL fold metallo-hydrolase [Lachnospiraceae bacterium]